MEHSESELSMLFPWTSSRSVATLLSLLAGTFTILPLECGRWELFEDLCYYGIEAMPPCMFMRGIGEKLKD